MYKVGVFPMKGLPPHRGHLSAIIRAGMQCEKLYVVVSSNKEAEMKLCEEANFKFIPLTMRARWLSAELSDLDHIQVLMLDEEGIPPYPNGWAAWSQRLNETVPEPFNAIFGGESQYAEEGYTKYFPEVKYIVHDSRRKTHPISATMIRENVYEHWDYLLGASRPYFAKKVLIVGTESCGKTSLTKMLAKEYYTSWAQEEGRYYSAKYMGGNEDVFNIDDFYNICFEQRQIEEQAMKTANRITFFDTDATITQFYCKMYLGEYNPKIEHLIDPDRYDLVLYLRPDVKWVDDGLRFNGEEEKRWKLDQELYQMFVDRGFDNKIMKISGNYLERFNQANSFCKDLMLE